MALRLSDRSYPDILLATAGRPFLNGPELSFDGHGDSFRLRVSPTRPGLRAEVLDPATRSRRQRESPVGNNQRRVEGLANATYPPEVT